jgi:hypothetical protein
MVLIDLIGMLSVSDQLTPYTHFTYIPAGLDLLYFT